MATRAVSKLRSIDPRLVNARIYADLRARNERHTRIARLLAVEHEERMKRGQSPTPTHRGRWN
jgi:hypothetical protein